MDRFALGRDSLSVALLGTFLATRPELLLDDSAVARLHRAHALGGEASLRGDLVYGLTTGVGPHIALPVTAIEALVAARATHLRSPTRLARAALVEKVDAAIHNIQSPGPQAQAVKQTFIRGLSSELLSE
jgi:histidine ammonia-lyase